MHKQVASNSEAFGEAVISCIKLMNL